MAARKKIVKRKKLTGRDAGPVAPRQHELGTMFRAQRERLGLRLFDVASQVGISFTRVSAIELGKGMPRPNTAALMVNALGFSKTAKRQLKRDYPEVFRSLIV